MSVKKRFLSWFAYYHIALNFGKRTKIFVNVGGKMTANLYFSIGFRTNSFRCGLLLLFME